MSRYIDKDTLLNRIVSLEQLARKRVYDTPTNIPCYERYVAQMQDMEHIISIIKAMPTADVVEVVRCEDCKYKDECIQYVLMCGDEIELAYCSYGERREV